MCRAVPIRLFVDADLAVGAEVALAPEQAHYAGNVRRRAAGDEVLPFNGRDGEWLARIGSLGKGQATLAVRSRTRAQQSGPDRCLVFAPIKRARLAFIAEKATELGVSALLPILTQRTIVTRLNTAGLRANVVEAAEQCGRLDVPELREPASLADLLAG